jgi:hypothetical protein
MEAIINIEDRLRVIKAIFEISIDAKIFPDDIYIYTINQKWETISNFRAESLSLSIDDPRHKKTIEIIYGLSNEIIALYDKLKLFLGELGAEFKYKIDCKPEGHGLGQLHLIKWKLESEERNAFQFINGEWWPYIGISNEDDSDFVFTSPLFLIYFVVQVDSFLENRILIEIPRNNQNKSFNKEICDYTVKSILIAYYYLYKKSIYPIPCITEKGKLTKFYSELAEKYHLSYDSFRTDWNKLNDKANRLKQPDNIKLSIKLLKTFEYPSIKDVMELATSELKEAELKN